MKLNYLVPAMVLIFIFTGCGGKMKLKPEGIQDEPANRKESTLRKDQISESRSGYSYNQSTGNNKISTNNSNVSNEETTLDIGASGSSNCVADSTSVYVDDKNNLKYNPLTSTGTTLGNDGIRKFVKTADMKFRVKSVIRSTYDIEDITHRFGGFVANTSLESKVDNVISTPVSKDSTLESTYYTIINTMLIRIPEAKMDSALREISPLVDYMDYRVIDVNDVHIQLIADALAQTRLKNYQGRMKNNVDGKGRDLEDITMAEESILARQEQADNTTIANLTLLDKIELATITIHLYQHQAVKREMVYNPQEVTAYQPGLGYKIKRSLRSGWNAIETILLFGLRFWPLIFLIAGGLVFWRWWSRR